MREARGIISIKIADDDPRTDEQILKHALAGYGQAEIVLHNGMTGRSRPVPPSARPEEFGEAEPSRQRPRLAEMAANAAPRLADDVMAQQLAQTRQALAEAKREVTMLRQAVGGLIEEAEDPGVEDDAEVPDYPAYGVVS